MGLFQKATKKQSKLRCALFGVSGAGKTYTALSIATGFVKAKLGKKIALIDSEHGSASKYSDRFNFSTCDLKDKSILSYVKVFEEAEKEGFDILIIDSMSHAWKELLTEVEKLAKAKFAGNTFRAWNEGNAKQNTFIDLLLSFKGHIISTMRSTTEWAISDDNGKMKPTRVGTKPEQGKGIEFEFDFLMDITPDHIGHILKDRTGKFQDQMIDKPGEEFGKELAAWLNEGEEDLQFYIQTKKEEGLKVKIYELAKLIGWDFNKLSEITGVKNFKILKEKELTKIKKDMDGHVKKYQADLKKKHDKKKEEDEKELLKNKGVVDPETKSEKPIEETSEQDFKKPEISPEEEDLFVDHDAVNEESSNEIKEPNTQTLPGMENTK